MSVAPPWSWSRRILRRPIPDHRSALGNGSIYLFGVDTYGSSLFNGDPFSRLYGVSELDPYINASLEGQDLIGVGDAFGESFLYYSAVNPSTRRLERKVTFVKRVVVYGLPILVGSGYYHPDEGP